VPAVIGFARAWGCAGKAVFEYWLRIALSTGLTGSSQLAVNRFRLSAQVLEAIVASLLPKVPSDDQTIVSEPAVQDQDHVVVPKGEFQWIKSRLPEVLTQLSPLLYGQLQIKREAARLAVKCCQSVGKRFTLTDIAPAFTRLIEGGPPDHRMHHVGLFLAGIACADRTLFLSNARNFVECSAGESHQFSHGDLQTYIAPALACLSETNLPARPMILALVDELSQSTRGSLKSAALTLVGELVRTLDQRELEADVMPVIRRLADDIDDGLQLETVNCVGTIARFTVSGTVLRIVRELFDNWFKAKPLLRLQVLRTLGANSGDIDSQFRDTYIIPKLVECVQPGFGWGDAWEQAGVIIVQFIASLKDQFSETVVRTHVVPIVQALSEIPSLAGDPMLKDLRDTFKGERGSRFSDFFQK
jgi:hypothetical protein